jgi:hypothetical protein
MYDSSSGNGSSSVYLLMKIITPPLTARKETIMDAIVYWLNYIYGT